MEDQNSKMKVLIVRHGRTQSNKERRYCGCRTDDPLSEEGRAELAEVSDEAGMIFVSPMLRARETAEILFPGMEQTVIDDLREMDFGIFEGRNHEEMDGDPVYQAWIDSMCEDPIPEGESKEDFMARTMDGFKEAVCSAVTYDDGTVIIVAHGGTVMTVMNVLFGGNYYDYYAGNGEGYRFELEVDDEGHIAAAGTYDRFCGRVRA